MKKILISGIAATLLGVAGPSMPQAQQGTAVDASGFIGVWQYRTFTRNTPSASGAQGFIERRIEVAFDGTALKCRLDGNPPRPCSVEKGALIFSGTSSRGTAYTGRMTATGGTLSYVGDTDYPMHNLQKTQ